MDFGNGQLAFLMLYSQIIALLLILFTGFRNHTIIFKCLLQ